MGSGVRTQGFEFYVLAGDPLIRWQFSDSYEGCLYRWIDCVPSICNVPVVFKLGNGHIVLNVQRVVAKYDDSPIVLNTRWLLVEVEDLRDRLGF